MIEKPEQDPQKNSGIFSPIRYVLSKEYKAEDGRMLMPFGSYETGRLREGNGNPESEEYDSLADFCVQDEGGLELRIPWLLIQSKDPSKKEFIGNVHEDGRGFIPLSATLQVVSRRRSLLGSCRRR